MNVRYEIRKVGSDRFELIAHVSVIIDNEGLPTEILTSNVIDTFENYNLAKLKEEQLKQHLKNVLLKAIKKFT